MCTVKLSPWCVEGTTQDMWATLHEKQDCCGTEHRLGSCSTVAEDPGRGEARA